jgi:hypothetical protein
MGGSVPIDLDVTWLGMAQTMAGRAATVGHAMRDEEPPMLICDRHHLPSLEASTGILEQQIPMRK